MLMKATDTGATSMNYTVRTSYSKAENASLIRNGYTVGGNASDAIQYFPVGEEAYEMQAAFGSAGPVIASAQRAAFDSARLDGGLVADVLDFSRYDINVIDFDGEYITAIITLKEGR